MARFLITAMPFTGHVAPMCAIAAELVAAGHDVRMYCGSAFRARIESTGARFVPWTVAPDFDELDVAATFPRLVGRKGFAQLMINMEDLFVGTAPAQLADVSAEWEREPWDALVSDEASLAPRLIADTLGCRWATVVVLPLYLSSAQGPPSGMGIMPGTNPVTRARDAALRSLVPVLSARLTRAMRRARAATQLPPTRAGFADSVFSPQLILASGVPALDYGRTDRPGHLTWIGRLAPPASAPELPGWWSDLDGRNVVLVTQGTQNVVPTDLLLPALEGLADLDAIVVATTGVPGTNELPGAPNNARVADFVPYDALLPYVDVMVTNGGWGGVLAAAAAGVPMVVAGGDLDKPENAARVAFSGAGLDLKTGTPSAAAIRKAVGRVLTEPGFTAAARRIAIDLETAGGARRAAELLGEFASA